MFVQEGTERHNFLFKTRNRERKRQLAESKRWDEKVRKEDAAHRAAVEALNPGPEKVLQLWLRGKHSGYSQ